MARTLESVPEQSLDALAEYVGRLKHDLGKYVSLQMRWLGEDASAAERRSALCADLLSTRRGPEGKVDAVTVWSEFRPGLVGAADLGGGVRVDLSDDDDVQALDVHMGAVAEVAARLRADAADEAGIHRGGVAARAVADACRSLHKRVRLKGRASG